jgi:hypothetical protein
MTMKIGEKLLVLLASSCFAAGCASGQGPLRLFVNSFSSFEAMQADLEKQDESSREPAQKLFAFDLSSIQEDVVQTYCIGGVDYCSFYGLSYKNHDPNYCPHLRYREAFVTCDSSAKGRAIVIFKNAVDPSGKLSWISSDGGNCYGYEHGFDAQFQYCLVDEKGAILLGAKFSGSDEEYHLKIFQYLQSCWES